MEILAACCSHWEIGEDDFNDHSKAKMGGEPCPTGRANLFDTRKILMCTPGEGKRRSMDFSHAPGKKKNAGVPVYRSTQRKVIRETSISFISLDEQNYKIP